MATLTLKSVKTKREEAKTYIIREVHSHIDKAMHALEKYGNEYEEAFEAALHLKRTVQRIYFEKANGK